MNIVSGSVNYF